MTVSAQFGGRSSQCGVAGPPGEIHGLDQREGGPALARVFLRASSGIGTGEPKPSPVAPRDSHNSEVDGLLLLRGHLANCLVQLVPVSRIADRSQSSINDRWGQALCWGLAAFWA